MIKNKLLRIISILLVNCTCVTLTMGQLWQQLPNYPGTERDDGVSFVINNKGYCVTGYQVGFSCTGNGFVLDASNETWGAMAALPTGNERQYATAFAHGNYGYITGGIGNNGVCYNDVWQYNAINDTWLALPNFTGIATQGASCFKLNNNVYILGGKFSNGNITNQVWQFNLTTHAWVQKNNLPIAGCWRGVAFSIDTLGYLCLGVANNKQYNHALYKYIESSDTWIKLNNLHLPALTYTGVAVCNGKACMYGGQDSSNIITNTLLVFNPIDSTLTPFAGIPTVGRKGTMAFSINNILYITTGITTTYTRTNETWKNTSFVGFDNNSNNLFASLYPNPASNILRVESKINTTSQLSIINALGQTLYTENLPANKHLIEISTTNFPSGIYFVKLSTNNNSSTQKLIISH